MESKRDREEGESSDSNQSKKAKIVEEPSQPTHVAEPSQPTHVAEPSQPAHVAEPSQPTHVAEPSQPTQALSPCLLPLDHNAQPIHSWNWFDRGILPPFKRQEPYLCWAYVIIPWLEALYFQKYNTRIELSLQELVDSVEQHQTDFHYSTHLTKAIKWVERNGLSLAQDYPYIGEKQAPKGKKKGAEIVRVKDVFDRLAYEGEVLARLQNKPLPAMIYYNNEKYYGMAVYNPKGLYRLEKKECNANKNHGVLLTGWDTTEAGENYYHVLDFNGKGAPNNGLYKVIRPSSITPGEKGPLGYFVDAELCDREFAP